MEQPPRIIILYLAILLSCTTGFSQQKPDVDVVISKLSGQSENIIKDSAVKQLLAIGKEYLPALSARFADATKSSVFSKCLGSYLTKGELAIIIADRIEGMPYYLLTNVQNCTMESCEDNPNFVEYYFRYTRNSDRLKTFQKRYEEWLDSADRKKRLRSHN